MPSASKPYKKLPGSGATAMQRVHLYLGPDHLLQVTSNGFTESYQRFFFQDIQAITLYHTVEGKIWNLIFGGIAALFVLIASLAGTEAMLPLLIIATFWLVIVAVNVIFGPTCACYVKTAVQTQKLPGLKRVRRARKIIGRIRPLIAQIQGEMPVEEMHRRLEPAGWQPNYGGAVPPAADDAGLISQ
jgi:hypothetical protein